jgi:hypothetical protein
MYKIIRIGCFALLFLCLLCLRVNAEVIELHVPIVDDNKARHLFFHELLTKAIESIGHTPKLIVQKLPQSRIKEYLDSGDISIFWMIESEERNRSYIPIEVGLTNKLIGKRILFIKKGDQGIFDKVRNLEDFRKLNLVGGMGQGWFDVKVWQANGLTYKEQNANYQPIFRMLAEGRDYNYFPRGLNEIMLESKEYPDLDVEKRLVLIYDRDHRFYLSKEGPYAGSKYKAILNSALKKAQDSGLIDRLVRKYWADDFKELHYDERIKINLKTPK